MHAFKSTDSIDSGDGLANGLTWGHAQPVGHRWKNYGAFGIFNGYWENYLITSNKLVNFLIEI